MTILLKKILHYASEKDVVTITPLTDCIAFDTGNGLEIQNNVLTLSLKNPLEQYTEIDSTIGPMPMNKHTTYSAGTLSIQFKEKDQVKVYLKRSDDASDLESTAWANNTTAPSSDYLVGVYYVTEYNTSNDEAKSPIRVICVDKTYILFNKIFAKAFQIPEELTTPELIQKVVLLSCQSADDTDVTAHTITTNGSTTKYDINAQLEPTGFIENTKTGGGSFPVKAITKSWKPVYEWLKDLSQIEYLNTDAELDSGTLSETRPFIYWVDEDGAFHWQRQSQTVGEGNTLTVGIDEITSSKFKKAVFDTKNMLVFNCGTDINGHGILHYVLDTTSDVKGLKMSYLPFTSIADDLYQNDLGASYTVNADRVDSGLPPKQYPSAYPVDTAWQETGVANDSAYNSTFRTACKNTGSKRASAVLSGLSHARWKGSADILGSYYTPGTLLEFTDQRQGLYKQLLRIMDVRHSVTKMGWVTNLTLEEDMKEILKYG